MRLGGAYWLVVAVATLFALARFSEAFLVLRVQGLGLPLALAPLTLVTMNVVYALAAYPAGALSDRLDRLTVAAIGFYLLIAADLVLAFAGGLAGAALGVALWGLHLGLTQGVLAALVADAAPADQRGAAFGVFNFVSGIAALVASLAAGALWDALGPARDLLRRRARLRARPRRAVARGARRAEPAGAARRGGKEVGDAAGGDVGVYFEFVPSRPSEVGASFGLSDFGVIFGPPPMLIGPGFGLPPIGCAARNVMLSRMVFVRPSRMFLGVLAIAWSPSGRGGDDFDELDLVGGDVGPANRRKGLIVGADDRSDLIEIEVAHFLVGRRRRADLRVGPAADDRLASFR